MDLRLCTLFYCHIQRSALLLRHVLPIQRCGTTVSTPRRILVGVFRSVFAAFTRYVLTKGIGNTGCTG